MHTVLPAKSLKHMIVRPIGSLRRSLFSLQKISAIQMGLGGALNATFSAGVDATK